MGSSCWIETKDAPVYLFGSYRLEGDGRLLRENQELHLPPKELQALRVLLENAGRIVSPLELKTELWGNIHVTADSIPRCISSLRSALLPDEYIQTVYKRGYRLTVPIERVDSSPLPAPLRIVILPFISVHGAPGHLGPAIAEEIIARLADQGRNFRFSVLARDSVFALAQQGHTAQKVGQILSAQLALTGSLHAVPDHYRLRVEAVRVADAVQLWVEDFLVSRAEVAGPENEIVERILARLGLHSLNLSASAEAPHLQPADPVRRDAYEAYRRGRLASLTPLRHHHLEGLQDLLRAVELDPTLVSAHIDLVNAFITRAYCGFLSPGVAAEQARRIARGVPNHSDGNAAILPAIGWIRFHLDHNLDGALRAFEQSADLDYDPCVSRSQVMFALSRHRFHEAIELLESALRFDPFAPWQHARLAWAWHLAGDAERSLHQADHALKLFPDHEGVLFYAAIILAYAGETQRALEITNSLTRSFPHFDLALALHGYALACAGRKEEAAEIVERLQWLGREHYVSSSFTPAILVKLHRRDAALAELRLAEEARCPWFFQMLADPRLKELHEMPDFKRMLGYLRALEASATQAG